VDGLLPEAGRQRLREHKIYQSRSIASGWLGQPWLIPGSPHWITQFTKLLSLPAAYVHPICCHAHLPCRRLSVLSFNPSGAGLPHGFARYDKIQPASPTAFRFLSPLFITRSASCFRVPVWFSHSTRRVLSAFKFGSEPLAFGTVEVSDSSSQKMRAAKILVRV